jgi:hypothetical protein
LNRVDRARAGNREGIHSNRPPDRRNLSAAWKIELELGNKVDLLEIGKKAMAEKKEGNANASKSTLSENDKVDLPKVNTQKEIAKAAGTSTGQVGMAEQVRKKSPELWEKAKAGDRSASPLILWWKIYHRKPTKPRRHRRRDRCFKHPFKHPDRRRPAQDRDRAGAWEQGGLAGDREGQAG